MPKSINPKQLRDRADANTPGGKKEEKREELTDFQKMIKGNLESITKDIQEMKLTSINMVKVFVEGPNGVYTRYDQIKNFLNNKKSILNIINQTFNKLREELSVNLNDVSELPQNGSGLESAGVICAKIDELIQKSSLQAKIILEGLDEKNLDTLLKLKEFNFAQGNVDSILNIIKFIETINSLPDIDETKLDNYLKTIQNKVTEFNNIVNNLKTDEGYKEVLDTFIENINKFIEELESKRISEKNNVITFLDIYTNRLKEIADNFNVKELSDKIIFDFSEDNKKSIDNFVEAVNKLNELDSYNLDLDELTVFIGQIKSFKDIEVIDSSKIKENISGFLEAIKDIGDINKELGNITSLKKFTSELSSQLDSINLSLDSYGDTYETILDIESRLNQVVQAIVGNDNISKLKSYTDTIYNFLNALPHEKLDAKPLTDSLKSYIDELINFFTKDVQDTISLINSEGEELNKIINTIMEFERKDNSNKVVESLQSYLDGIIDYLNTGDAQIKKINKFGDKIKTAVGNILEFDSLNLLKVEDKAALLDFAIILESLTSDKIKFENFEKYNKDSINNFIESFLEFNRLNDLNLEGEGLYNVNTATEVLNKLSQVDIDKVKEVTSKIQDVITGLLNLNLVKEIKIDGDYLITLIDEFNLLEKIRIPDLESEKLNNLSIFFSSISNIGESLDYKTINKIKKFFTQLGKLNLGEDVSSFITSLVQAIPADKISKTTVEMYKDGGSKTETVDVLIAGEQIKALSSLIDVFYKLGADFDYKKIRKNFRKLGNSISDSIPDFIECIKEIDIKETDFERIERTSKLLEDLGKLNKKLASSLKENTKALITAKITKSVISSLIDVIVEFKNHKFQLSKKEGEQILDTLSNLSKIVDNLNSISKSLAKISLTSLFAVLGVKAISLIIKAMPNLLVKVRKIQILSRTVMENKGLDNLAKIIKDLAIISGSLALVAVTAFAAYPGIILATGVIMGSIMIANVINKSTKGVSKAGEGIGEFMKLLLAASAIVTLGAVMGSFIVKHWKEILLFEVLLATFIGLTVGVYKMSAKDVGEAMEYADNFASLIIVSAAVMLLGAMFLVINPKLAIGAIAFTVLMAAFIGATVFAYKLAARDIEDALEVAPNFAVLVAVSAFVLLLGGGLFAAFPQLMITCLAFGLELALFIGLVTFAYTLGAGAIAQSLEAADNFAVLVAVSAFTLLIGGGLFLAFPGMMITTLVFALILAAFIGIISAVYCAANVSKVVGMVGNNFSLKQALIGGSQDPFSKMMYIVSVSAAMLLIGGWLFMKHPELIIYSIVFAVITGAFIWGISKVVKLVQRMNINKKTIATIGLIELLVAGVAGLIYIGGKAIDSVGGINGILNVVAGLGIMMLFITAVFGLAVLIGTLMEMEVMKVKVKYIVWGALAVMGAIELLILGLSFILRHIAGTIDMMKKIKVSGSDMLNMIKIVGSFIGMGWMLLQAMPLSLLLPLVLPAILSMGIALSVIANTVSDYANLKVPIYEGTKVVGYRQLSKRDFQSASENVGLVVTTLGGAIMDVWSKHKDWFGSAVSNLLFGVSNNPMSVVCRTVWRLGMVISEIAKGVKDYAELKVPIYEGTKQIGYRNLTTDDFSNASKNVGLVVTTLGNAIMSVFEAHKDWFANNSNTMWDAIFGKSTYSQDNPFYVVLKTVAKLGMVISDISKGVTVYATGIPVYNEEGKVIKKEPINDAIIQNINKNIASVISVLGESIMNMYDTHPEWFIEDRSWLVGDKVTPDGPFGVILGTVGKLGKVISDISKGITVYATGIPIYDDKGKVIGKKEIDQTYFDNIKQRIGGEEGIIAILSNSIMSLYDEHPEWFIEDRSWLVGDKVTPDGPFGVIIGTVAKLGKTIADISKGIVAFATGVPKYNEEGKIIGYEEINEEVYTAASNTITSIIGCIAETILDCVETNPEWFDDGEDSEFAVASAAIGNLSNMVTGIAKSLKDIASLRLPIYDNKGHITGYEPIDTKLFDAAEEAISKIVTAIGNVLIAVVQDNEDLFDDDEDSPGAVAAKAIGGMGNLISSIGKSLKDIAALRLPIYDEKGNIIDYQQLDKSIFNTAADAINKVIWGIVSPIKNICESKDFEDLTEDGEESPFYVVGNTISKMASLISAIGSAIKDISEGCLVKGEFTKGDGTKFTYSYIDDKVIKTAQEVIEKTIRAIGDVLSKIAKDPLVNIWKLDEIATSLNKTTNLVATIGDVLLKLGSGTITVTDKNGKMKTIPISDDTYVKVGITVSAMVLCLAKALTEASKDLNSWMSSNNVSVISEGLNNLTGIIVSIADVILKLGAGLPVYKDGKIDHYEDITKNLDKVKLCVSEMLIGLGEALLSVMNSFSEKYVFFLEDENNMAKTVFEGIKGMTEPIVSIADLINSLAGGNMPIMDSKGNIIGYNSIMDKVDTNTLKTFLKDLVGMMPKLLKELWDDDNIKSFLATDFGDEKTPIQKMNIGITTVNTLITGMISKVEELIKNEELMKLADENDTRLSNVKTALDKILDTYARIHTLITVNSYDGITFLTTMTNLVDEKKWKEANTNLNVINTLVKNLIKSIFSIYNDNDKDKIIKLATDSEITDNIKNSITKVSTAYSDILTLLSGDSIIKKLRKIDEDNYEDAKEGLKILNSTIKYIIKSYVKLSNDKNILSILNEDKSSNLVESLTNVITSYKNILKKLEETDIIDILSDIDEDDYKDAKKGLIALRGMMSSLFKTIIDINSKYSSEEFTNISSITGLFKNLINIITIDLKDLVEKINESDITDILEELSDNYKIIRNGLQTINSIQAKLYDLIVALQLFNQLSLEKETLKLLINDFGEVVETIINVTNKLNEIDKDNNYNAIYNLEREIQAIDNIVKVGESIIGFKEDSFDGFVRAFDKLTKGLTVDEKNIKLLERELKSVEKFRFNVNSISENKVNSITKLSNALVKVTSKFGTLEKLTEALSTKLNETLVNLTEKLETASTIINKTEEIQTNRQKKLEESISKIKEIMAQQLTVKVDATELAKLREQTQSPSPGAGDGADTKPSQNSNLSGDTINYSSNITPNSVDDSLRTSNTRNGSNGDDIVTKLVAALSSVTLNVRQR